MSQAVLKNDKYGNSRAARLLLIARSRPIREWPQPIADAVKQTRISGDLRWLASPVVIQALIDAHAAYGNEKRKFGTFTGVAHEVWGAHQVYRDCLEDRELKRFLSKEGLSAIAAVVLWIYHDRLENLRSLANKRGETFNPNPIMRDIENKCDGLLKAASINKYIVEFMTDAPGLHKKTRLDAQQAKAYNAKGEFCLDPLAQELRLTDKTSQVVVDGLACKAGDLSSDDAATCLEQAKARMFVLKYPMASNFCFSYWGAMNLLKQKAAQKKKHNVRDGFRKAAHVVLVCATNCSRTSRTLAKGGQWVFDNLPKLKHACIL
jgi:hypothetical protein